MVAPDFSGYATKNDLVCSDGLTIKQDAFKHQDKMQVPLVWNHDHKNPENILGHAILENREDGVYVEAFFNETDTGKMAKEMVRHGDINAMSIWAGQLKKKAKDVVHGMIREVSLVVKGANPGALIDWVNLAHADGTYSELNDEAIIYTGLEFFHADNEGDDMADQATDQETVADVIDSMDEKQKNVLYYMVGEALASGDDVQHSDDEDEDDEDDDYEDDEDDEDDKDLEHSHKEGADVTRNLFDQTNKDKAQKGATLSHSQITTIFEDAEKMGSLKESFLAHATEYGIENIDLLFPDAKTLQNTPELISRQMEWVSVVLNGVRKSPFSRVKTVHADITADEARAKGYVKGNYKKDEWFKLQKRVTTPTTVYKKQKLDRDDILDITDLDVVAFMKAEMRLMLNEEIARAILVGDGREIDDEDKVNEEHLRPIAHDDEFYNHKLTVTTNIGTKALIQKIIRERPKYKGSNPAMFMTEELLMDMLLETDKLGRDLYPTVDVLARKLRVSAIHTVEVMEGVTTDEGDLLAIMVNLNDYVLGSDRGGQMTMFDDFDIDYNQYKYLMETRISGALTKFKSAMTISRTGGIKVDVTNLEPAFDAGTGVVTIPSVTGVEYYSVVVDGDDTLLSAGAQPALNPGDELYVYAQPTEGYYLPHNTDEDWTFSMPEA